MGCCQTSMDAWLRLRNWHRFSASHAAFAGDFDALPATQGPPSQRVPAPAIAFCFITLMTRSRLTQPESRLKESKRPYPSDRFWADNRGPLRQRLMPRPIRA